MYGVLKKKLWKYKTNKNFNNCVYGQFDCHPRYRLILNPLFDYFPLTLFKYKKLSFSKVANKLIAKLILDRLLLCWTKFVPNIEKLRWFCSDFHSVNYWTFHVFMFYFKLYSSNNKVVNQFWENEMFIQLKNRSNFLMTIEVRDLYKLRHVSVIQKNR